MLVGFNSNEFLPVIPFIETDEVVNSYRKRLHIDQEK